VEDLLQDPQLRAVGFFDESSASDGRQLRRIAARYRAPTAQPATAAPSPRVGQHTHALLTASF
jgi:crotonobetainyl-CoA:carnitine CoA-transferase CaiB-like acyl-CoA transferase